MSEYISHSEHDTEDIGASFARTLKGGTVVAMYGDLGAGKTAFVRGMARGMGLDCRVSSPTFTIVNEYLGERELIHFDMYRLSSADELFDAAAQAAAQGAEATKQYVSKFGRAKSYGTKTIGTPDAGAVSMSWFFQGLARE